MSGALEGFALKRDDALFVDFDGTLADIRPDPDSVGLPAEAAAALLALADLLGGAVAVISGRSLRDLASRTPDSLWRAGTHGLEQAAPNAALPPPLPGAPEALLAPFRSLEHAFKGTWLEVKGPAAAFHFRSAPEAEAQGLAAAEEAAAAVPGYVVQPGKMIVEVKPEGANKGVALRRMASGRPFAGRRVVMIGDDRTDEDAFDAAQALGGIAIKIGPGATAATLRGPDPTALRAWLQAQAEHLG
ncbi:trehalose-phosphatase [Cribrihabitans neustonicus]|uniref:trehalose-phosphatase n=1 Tax=Cribrihabitans neustonicus TaxID=1429085 RepID=UPI003B5BB0C5